MTSLMPDRLNSICNDPNQIASNTRVRTSRDWDGGGGEREGRSI